MQILAVGRMANDSGDGQEVEPLFVRNCQQPENSESIDTPSRDPLPSSACVTDKLIHICKYVC
jgi:hypothetical protein